jgi:hypothetical protein
MRRREFITGLGTATLWPAVAPAQQPTVRRIGTLMGWANAGSNHANFEAFVERLGEPQSDATGQQDTSRTDNPSPFGNNLSSP